MNVNQFALFDIQADVLGNVFTPVICQIQAVQADVAVEALRFVFDSRYRLNNIRWIKVFQNLFVANLGILILLVVRQKLFQGATRSL